MPTPRRIARGATVLALAGTVVAIGGIPIIASAADHLDAPTAKADSRIDITDLYAFRSGSSTTTLVLDVNPLKSPADTKTTVFGTNALYQFKIDTNGDAVADIAYRVHFTNTRTLPDGTRVQDYMLRRATGAAARADTWAGELVSVGQTTPAGRSVRTSAVRGGGLAFAGPRDDPFFFDLPGFVTFKERLLAGETQLSNAGKTGLLDGFTGTDTFAGTNVTAIALQLPNTMLGGAGKTVGVWATTSTASPTGWVQVDRIGRPAVNTIFNITKAEKEADNRLSPSADRATFHDNVVGVFTAVGKVLTANGATPYTADQVEGLAGVLLPDLLTIKLGDPSGFLNGRRLTDDVVDTAFSLLTNGVLTTGDGVNANDKAFSSSFPYVAAPTLP